MKSLSQLTVLTIDRGLFAEMALRMAKDVKRMLYHIPNNTDPFPVLNSSMVGYGMEGLEVVDSIFGDHFDEVDLFFFPDCGDGELQDYLVRQGKTVWGSRMGCEIELDRPYSKELLESVGLPVGPHKIIKGVKALRLWLKAHKNQFVKVSRFRGCFDDQTDILTESGWKRFDSLKNDDRVATMSLETRQLEFVEPTAYIKYWHDGKMMKIKGGRIDALVTPNHCLWTQSRTTTTRHGRKLRWKYKSVDSLMGKVFHIPATCKWEGRDVENFTIPKVFGSHGSKVSRVVKMDDWLEFLGWFVSEGSIGKAGPLKKAYRVLISQSKKANPEKWKRISDVIDRLGFPKQKECDNGWSVYDKSIFVELITSCYSGKECPCCKRFKSSHTKSIPEFIKELSTRQIKIFLEAYRLGDGNRHIGKGRKPQSRYYTSSPQLADDLQELFVRCGLSSGITSRVRGPSFIRGRKIHSLNPQFTIGERETDDLQIQADAMSLVDYSGFVFDVTVEPHHTILVRRNGNPFWSGNSTESFFSRTYKDIEPHLDEMEFKLGPLKEIMVFDVEDSLPDKCEVGSDSWSIDGVTPKTHLAGIEVKDAGYAGRIGRASTLPKPLTMVDEKMAPLLKDFGYRGFYSTECRIGKDGIPYMIDFCARSGNPPGFLQTYMLKNYSEIIWRGANGECVEPEYDHEFGVQLQIKSSWADQEHWQPIDFDQKYRDQIKIVNPCKINGRFYCVPLRFGIAECGSVVGTGDSIAAAAKSARKAADTLEGYMLKVGDNALDDALDACDEARDLGVDLHIS